MRNDPGDSFRAYALRRFLAAPIVALGSRAVVVVRDELPPALGERDHSGRGSDGDAGAMVTVFCGNARPLSRARFSARGDVARIPVQSDAATGVWLHRVLDDGAAGGDEILRRRAFRESARLLQPGGVLVVVARVTVPSFESCVAFAVAAGLTVRRRVAVHRDAATASLPRVLWALSARRAAAVAADVAATEPVIAILVAERRDPSVAEMPDAREIIGSFFLPRAWVRRDSKKG